MQNTYCQETLSASEQNQLRAYLPGAYMWNRRRSKYIGCCIITSLICSMLGNETFGRESGHSEKSSPKVHWI